MTALSEQFQLDYTPGIGESLWEYFKTLQLWQGERLLTPVLVIDQFEEIFTLKTPAERQDWVSQLGDLLRETLPLALRKTSSLTYSEVFLLLYVPPPIDYESICYGLIDSRK